MLKGLIEKIDKVIYDTVFDYMRDSKNAYICICELRKRIKELIESYSPKVVDKPDSEGWWFVRIKTIGYYVRVSINANGVFCEFPGHAGTYNFDHLNQYGFNGGKWQKAVTPELE